MAGELRRTSRFTQADVAERAGVSRATVSAVMNKTRYVSPDMEERVREAMADLAYEPNAIARGLKFSRTFTIGLLLPNIHSPFWPAVVQGIEDSTRAHKYNVLFYSTNEDEEQEMAGLGLFRGRQVDGMLVAPAGKSHAEYLARIDATAVPVVLLDRRLEESGLSSVTVDNFKGAYGAVKHLVEGGRKRIGAITIPETISTGRDRVEGYCRALEDFGLKVDRSLVRTTSFTVEESYAQTLKLFDLPEPPDAIFATNHSAVIGALMALKDLEKKVPDEVAIVGFDDHPWMSLMDPPLTTVSQPMYELGARATELLIQKIESEGQGGDGRSDGVESEIQHIVLETTFVHRSSCGC